MYDSPDFAVVTSVLVNVGASFTFATLIVNSCVAAAPLLSVAVNTTLLLTVPTLSFNGVPLNTPVDEVNVNQLGMVVSDNVTVSPSASVATAV